LRPGELRDLAPLHAEDREMHPEERDRGNQEEEHEATGRDADQVVHPAEGDGQDEAPEAADQPDHAADRADAPGVIDRDVLVVRGLAEAHEEAEGEGQQRERNEADREGEPDRPANAVDHVGRRRIGEKEGCGDGAGEAPVHHAPRTVPVGQRTAEDAEQRAGDRVGGSEHASGDDAEAVDVDIVVREPQGEGDEAAEDEEVVEREAPDLELPERREHCRH